MSRFSSNQIVTMVCAVAAAVVLAPVGVMAATGQLVNIVDPSNAGRAARVGSGGTLHVETRPGAVQNSFTRQINTTELGNSPVYEVTAPQRIALTQLTVSNGESDYPETEVRVNAYVQTTGTAACGTTTTGYTQVELARFVLPPKDTRQILWNGPPLVVPSGASGKKSCVVLYLQEHGSPSETFYNVSGYTFS
ncbi:MAG TPA: hypothetical protein VGX28_02520 [Frankiaceae bacterium]|jgi:hypothetical protein|nr:hypothetical protein [Frankiaceae bacterium]